MAKTADFHGRISAGIDCKHKMVIHVFTEWALWGLERGAERSFPFLCCRHRDAKQNSKLRALIVKIKVASLPRRQAEQKTPGANSKNQSRIATATPSREVNS